MTDICNRRISILVRFIVLISVLLLIAACARGGKSFERKVLSPDIKTIAIVPYTDATKIFGERSGARSPISGKTFVTGSVAGDALLILDENTNRLMSDLKTFRFVSAHTTRNENDRLMLEEKGISLSEKDRIREVGRRTGADAVMVGYVFRFQSRVGSEYAARSPASVAFDLSLVRVSDGRVLWFGYMDETQQNLSSNLLDIGVFVERDAKWITAERMAVESLEKMAAALQ